jgi:hypothetical protein
MKRGALTLVLLLALFAPAGALAQSVGESFIRYIPPVSVSAAAFPLLAPSGTAAAPSYSFTASPGTGMFWETGQSLLGFAHGGTARAFMAAEGIRMPNGNHVGFCTGADCSATDASIARGPISGSLKIANGGAGDGILTIGNGTAASPSVQFTADADGSGTGIYRSGANTLDIANNGTQTYSFGVSGMSTANSASITVTGSGTFAAPDGTAALPSYRFNSSGSTGFSYNTTANDALVTSKGGVARTVVTGDRTLTDATATTIFQIAIANAEVTNLQVHYSVTAVNGTPDYQGITGTFYVSIVNKSATETCSTITEAGETSAVSAGTITFTATCDTSPANAVNIQVNSDSSLTTPTIVGQFIIHRSGIGTGAITIS